MVLSVVLKKESFNMIENCCSQPSAGSEACELTLATVPHTSLPEKFCQEWQQKGKVVQGQTVKALLSIDMVRPQG